MSDHASDRVLALLSLALNKLREVRLQSLNGNDSQVVYKSVDEFFWYLYTHEDVIQTEEELACLLDRNLIRTRVWLTNCRDRYGSTVPCIEEKRGNMPDPSRVLLDCSLPLEIIALLSPVLERMGLSLQEIELRDPLVYRSMRRVTRVTAKEGNRLRQDHLCVYIPSWLLSRETPSRLDALNSMVFSFPLSCVVHIFTDSSLYPAAALHRILQQRWQEVTQGVVNWVPKRDIDELLVEKPDMQEMILQDVLKLNLEEEKADVKRSL